MMDEIGAVAGEIWALLNERGELSISGVVSEINASHSIAYMSLGWLAREGKLVFVKKSRGVFVKLT
ncbi:MAG: winged helix-turn-helix domain-containing protein [Halobacteriota archaeon]